MGTSIEAGELGNRLPINPMVQERIGQLSLWGISRPAELVAANTREFHPEPVAALDLEPQAVQRAA